MGTSLSPEILMPNSRQSEAYMRVPLWLKRRTRRTGTSNEMARSSDDTVILNVPIKLQTLQLSQPILIKF